MGNRWTNCGKLPWTGLSQGQPCAAQELGVTVNHEEGAPSRSGNPGSSRSVSKSRAIKPVPGYMVVNGTPSTSVIWRAVSSGAVGENAGVLVVWKAPT